MDPGPGISTIRFTLIRVLLRGSLGQPVWLTHFPVYRENSFTTHGYMINLPSDGLQIGYTIGSIKIYDTPTSE